MKTRITYLTALCASVVMMTACSGEETTAEKEQDQVEICQYSYNHGSTTLEWTAYKTNDKVGVPGGFNEIMVESETSEDPIDVIESISFTINTSSVETNNEDRNGKVAEHFFGTINTEEITGSIKELKDDGNAVIEIYMNGIAFNIEGPYELDGSDFSFETSIDVVNWNALSGIEALNEVCKDLHTGKDGVSKLWSEVTLSLSTSLSSDCD